MARRFLGRLVAPSDGGGEAGGSGRCSSSSLSDDDEVPAKIRRRLEEWPGVAEGDSSGRIRLLVLLVTAVPESSGASLRGDVEADRIGGRRLLGRLPELGLPTLADDSIWSLASPSSSSEDDEESARIERCL